MGIGCVGCAVRIIDPEPIPQVVRMAHPAEK